MDEKKSRDDEYHPTPKKFKANPGNDSMESLFDFSEIPENIRASTSDLPSDSIRAFNHLASTEAGKIPVIQL